MKRTLPLAGLGLLSLVACSSDDDSSGAAPGERFAVDAVVQDAPSDDLSSFSLDITEVRLLDGGGVATDNLLGATRRVELLGLQFSGEWLFRSDPPEDTYTGVRFVFDPGTVVARDLAGNEVAVNVASSSIDSTFDAPITVTSSGYARFVLDVELDESLAGDVGAPPLAFDPVIDADSTGLGVAIEEIEGLVTLVQGAGGSFLMTAFPDEDPMSAVGLISVLTDLATEFVDENDQRYASRDAFFADLVPFTTRVEVHGALGTGGTVVARRIEVEDSMGGGAQVEIEGRVTDVDPGVSFDLLITEIEDGAQIAANALAGLGNPSIIEVTFDGATVFRADDDGPFLDPADLAVGQEVEVRFDTFTSPFRADRVEIEGDAERYATLTGLGGLPDEVVVRLRPGDPAITAGLVASTTTDVTVNIASAQLVLDVDVPLLLGTGDLVTGVTVEVFGPIGGTAMAPVVTASRVEVEPGEFEGFVSGADAINSSFDATVTDLEEPFGGGATVPPFTVVIEPGCVFTGEATTEAEFFALFTGLQPGEQLEVEVEGLGELGANRVRAFQIEAEVD